MKEIKELNAELDAEINEYIRKHPIYNPTPKQKEERKQRIRERLMERRKQLEKYPFLKFVENVFLPAAYHNDLGNINMSYIYFKAVIIFTIRHSSDDRLAGKLADILIPNKEDVDYWYKLLTSDDGCDRPDITYSMRSKISDKQWDDACDLIYNWENVESSLEYPDPSFSLF